MLFTVVVQADNGDDQKGGGLFPHVPFSGFHEPGKYFEDLNTQKVVTPYFLHQKTTPPRRKHRWPTMSACHVLCLVESFFVSLENYLYAVLQPLASALLFSFHQTTSQVISGSPFALYRPISVLPCSTRPIRPGAG